MAIANRQIGWSAKSNLLWQISKQLERLTQVMGPNKIRDLLNLFKLRVGFNDGTFEAETCLDATLINLDNVGLLDKASLIMTPNAYNTGVLYDIVPNSNLGDMNVVRATTATRVNSEGLIESVGLNIPRLDYSNGICPSLLVEPLRTNIFTYSEQFNNSFWIKGAIGGAANPVVTPNDSISPNGTMTADKVVFPTIIAGQTSIIFVPISSTNQNFTQSYYIKGLLGTEVIWIAYTSSGVTFFTKVCNLTTDWQRFDLSALIPSGANNVIIGVDTRDPLQTARPAQTIFIWGAQLEVAANATSYIPTVASTVTRNADVLTVAPPVGTVKITTTFENLTTQVLTVIPATYTIPQGRISYVLMQHTI